MANARKCFDVNLDTGPEEMKLELYDSIEILEGLMVHQDVVPDELW